MSGSPTQPDDTADGSADGGVIPVEVESPEAPPSADAPTAEDPPVAAVAPAPPDPLAEATAKIAVLEKEKKDNWDRYLRAAADLENMRKRQKREIDDARHDTKNRVLKEILPVVDNLERAVEHAGDAEDPKLKPIIEGVHLVLRQFQTAFERLEVSPVPAEGQPFDPNMHEAISQAESELPPGTVVQVLQRGYRAGDRLLRPALVVVAKAKAESS